MDQFLLSTGLDQSTVQLFIIHCASTEVRHGGCSFDLQSVWGWRSSLQQRSRSTPHSWAVIVKMKQK